MKLILTPKLSIMYQHELLKLQSKCNMLADRMGNIENINDERDSGIIASLECQNKFLVQEVKTLNLKLERLEKEVKAANAINTQAKIISSPKTTHVNKNTRVINNLLSMIPTK